jgi:pimeloyl-ACP methyl ester carboxylesterase
MTTRPSIEEIVDRPAPAEDELAGMAARGVNTSVGGFTVHSVEYGSGDECIVLIHGLSGSSRWWARNAPELADGYRVVIPDLVGFGRSARPTLRLPGIPAAADLLVDWMGARRLRRAHVIGHSMGGQVAIHLAAEHPERVKRLVLADAAGIPRAITARALARLAAEASPLWRWGDPRFLPVIARDALIAGPLTLVRSLTQIMRDDVRPLLPRIEAPTLIVWGEYDSLVPLSHAGEMREAIPDARMAVLRAASHNPMVDRPADFNRLVLRFLEGEAVGR